MNDLPEWIKFDKEKGKYVINNDDIEELENTIIELKIKENEYADKANEAYKIRDFKTEDKWQEKIDECKRKSDEIKSKIIDLKYKDIDIEEEIEKMRSQHRWDKIPQESRCDNCAMKNHTTFEWKVKGVRECWKEGLKSDAFDILKGMECKK